MPLESSHVAVEPESRPRRRRGLKPGQRHAGQFKQGYDPRRHLEGPRVVKKEFQAAIREHTDKAIQVLSDCMDDATAPWKERQAAAELVLAHGHGSPVNRVLHAQANGDTGQAPAQMTLEDLRRKAASILEDPESTYESTYEEIPDDENQAKTTTSVRFD